MRLIKRIKTMFGAGEQEQIVLRAESEFEVSNKVAFKNSDKPTEALRGYVVAIKGSEAVVEVKQLLGCQTFILPFDELIVIPSKAQEQSND